MSLEPVKQGRLRSIGDLGAKFGAELPLGMPKAHHDVLVKHGYEFKGSTKTGVHTYRHDYEHHDGRRAHHTTSNGLTHTRERVEGGETGTSHDTAASLRKHLSKG